MLVPILIFLFLNENYTTKSRTFSEFSHILYSLWDFDLSSYEAASSISIYDEIWEVEIKNLKLTNHGKTMAEWIKNTYPNAPYMLHVANCESAGLIHKKNGQLLRRLGGSDSGVLQINGIHKAKIAKMGLDLNNETDYFTFARHLYDKKGTRPWYMSKRCWEPHYNRINEILTQI